ncbi:MAG: NADP-dependent isocitrate dehydrogenase [Thermoanaerobaculia bacterium]
MPDKTPITVAHGDGIGPEIMAATLEVLRGAGAHIVPDVIEIGEKVYQRGVLTGIEPSAWESLRRTRVFLKAPITTPQGGGYKSLNVTIRKAFGLYANVRPCVAYHPFVETLHPGMDVVIIRENEEDLYAGIEYRQTGDVMQCLKLITRPGCERIVRYAFEYARRNGRRKVTCFTKDNIMKLTDGLFHKVFDEVAAEFPDVANEHWIVDIGAAKLADTPRRFDVVVIPNLYGDILSDVTAQIAGSVGLAGSANIGVDCAMFEAIHGSAPRRAGQNVANPSGLLLGGVMMLVHIGQADVAERIHNAWLRTIEDGIHTYDIHTEGVSREKVGTREFAAAVVARLGARPETFKPVSYAAAATARVEARAASDHASARKLTVGVDVFLDWTGGNPEDLARRLEVVAGDGLRLSMIDVRGVKVWPEGIADTAGADHWRCRFLADEATGPVGHAQIVRLLDRLATAGLDFIQTENLCTFDGQRGYSAG